MKTKTFFTATALASALTIAGTAFAGSDAHEAYQRAFYGDSGVAQVQAERSPSMGKAAYGTASTTQFAGPKGGIMVLTHNGLAPWSGESSDNAIGKAAFGTAASGTETGLNSYHRAFYGD